MPQANPTIEVRVEIYHCPLCEWEHREPFLPVSDHTLANVFGPGIMANVAFNQKNQRVEQALDDHLRTHTVLEWLGKINKLEAELRCWRESAP